MMKRYSLLKTLLLTGLVAGFTASVSAQVLWSNPITGTNPNIDNPYTAGQTYNVNVFVSGIGRGTGITGTNSNNRYNATGWTGLSPDTADYFYFTLTPIPGYMLNFTDFSFTYQSSSAASADSFAVRSSIDGFTTDITGPSGITTFGNGVAVMVPLSGASFQNISTAVTFKVFAWNATSAAGTFSINDFSFSGAAPLSISFESFNVIKRNSAAYLSWKLGGKDEGAIMIQHSNDGRTFTDLETVGTEVSSYSHENPSNGTNYYRLAAVKSNGDRYYTKTLLLNFSKGFTISVFPNPVKDQLHLTGIEDADVKTITVYDAIGSLVKELSATNLIPVHHLSAGVYYIRVVLNDGSVGQQIFVVGN
ncbi:MAG TPA: T9SS type A sorting domain-containing protein [Flavipsychrobacter sp.]|nr:T9SS type A sorting domain-containing protein [Flavipsychrobacter sp.]